MRMAGPAAGAALVDQRRRRQLRQRAGPVVGVEPAGGAIAGLAGGVDPASVALDSLIQTGAGAALDGPLRGALALAVANLFLLALAAAFAGLLVVWIAPRGKIAQLAAERALARQDYN